MRRRLTSAGYRAGLVDAAIEQLTAQGYLDDAAFARAWVASRDRSRPRGERALRAELLLKAIDRSIVDEVLAERVPMPSAPSAENELAKEENEDTTPDQAGARRLIDKHRRALMRETDPRRRRQKAYALLARNGFDPDVCRTVAASVDDEPDAGDEDLDARGG